MNFEDQVRAWKRRHGELSLQAAKYGIAADPHISMEIEDLDKKLGQVEEIRHQLGLLDKYRRNVQTYTDQVALYGGGPVPPSVVNGLHDQRRHIGEIKEALRERYKVMVEDLPSDIAPVKTTSPIPASPLVGPPDVLTALDEGLDELAQMLAEENYVRARRYIRTLKALVAQGRFNGQ